MILVDSSVWIDLFRDADTPQTRRLETLRANEEVGVGDLVLVEVLRGFTSDGAFDRASRLMAGYPQITIGGHAIAVAAATHYRALRGRGVTVGTVDALIATRCIMDGHALLFSDRDFDPFVQWLGLRDAVA